MLSNGYWVGFMQGKIYQGPLKMGCIPGLNCYACPGALGSCPIGAMQNCLAGVNRRPSFVVLGYLLVFGSILGRVVCGWLCPIGLIQDALQYLRPVSKRGRSLPGHNRLRYFKYVILFVFVIFLPAIIIKAGAGSPWFCKYICPLGAIYGIFNKVALIRLHVSLDRCISCGRCTKTCPMDIDVVNNPNSVECIRCGRCVSVCPTQAINLGVKQKFKAADVRFNSKKL
ncbi:MAG: 4Fe-4S binding protein [Clostridiaceae bacterium]|nr:4Fe-4S binding protein [Clostridiaceae bacterium]